MLWLSLPRSVHCVHHDSDEVAESVCVGETVGVSLNLTDISNVIHYLGCSLEIHRAGGYTSVLYGKSH